MFGRDPFSRPLYLSDGGFGDTYGNYGRNEPFGLSPNLGMRELALDVPKVHHIPGWERMGDKARVAVLRQIAESSGRDPRVRALAAQIVSGVDQRQYEQQAAALLRWVQENVAYLNEPGEILQDPLYSVKVKHGDCDDLALVLAALLESIRLPWRFVLSGQARNGAKSRWIEGDTMPWGVQWAHIYIAIGDRPFSPTRWTIAEPTVRGSPLGHDAAMTGRAMPEMGGGGAMGATPPYGFAPFPTSSVAPFGYTSPSALLPGIVSKIELDWRYIASAALVTTLAPALSLLGNAVLDAIRGRKR